MTDGLELWTFSDAHVGTDASRGRRSLAEALSQSEEGGPESGEPFEWDLALDLGDMSGGQDPPEDAEGEEVVSQFRSALRSHAREQIYDLGGNHDRGAPNEPEGVWWRRWVDPLGENRARSGVDPHNRPFPIDGTWERYMFQVGNILFLMMSDANEPTQRPGRGVLGGNPGGVVSGDTFRWWVEMVESNQNKIIMSAHHYVLKSTTVAFGPWEGVRRRLDGSWESHYHGYKPLGTPQAASYLYWVDRRPGAGAFESYLAEHPGTIDIWMGGHTHTHPDDTHGGRSHIERRWGVWFANVSALTAYHGATSTPMSRVWSFEADRVVVRCYLHTSDHAPQGFYDRAAHPGPPQAFQLVTQNERKLPLTRIHILGAGTPTPTPERFGSAYVVDTGGDLVMFDCGPAATHKMVKSGLFPTQIDHLFFTHHHFDHDADYPCFLLCRWDQSIGQEEVLTVRGPTLTERITEGIIGEDGAFAHDWKARVGAPVSRRVFENRGGTLPRPAPVVDSADIEAGDVFETDRWRVRSAHAQHVQPFLDSLAYRIESDAGDVVITGDTEPCQSVVDLARGASVLMSMCWDHQETMDGDGEHAGQTGTLGAARMAREAGVEKLVLVHRGPALETEESAERALHDVSAIFGGEVIMADELDVIEV